MKKYEVLQDADLEKIKREIEEKAKKGWALTGPVQGIAGSSQGITYLATLEISAKHR